MSWLDNLDADAKAVVSWLAAATMTAGKVNLEASWGAIKETFANPKEALVDGAVQTDLYTAANVLAVLAMLPTPASVAFATAAAAVKGVGMVEPQVAKGIAIMTEAGVIPEVTRAHEQWIADHLDPTTDAPKMEK